MRELVYSAKAITEWIGKILKDRGYVEDLYNTGSDLKRDKAFIIRGPGKIVGNQTTNYNISVSVGLKRSLEIHMSRSNGEGQFVDEARAEAKIGKRKIPYDLSTQNKSGIYSLFENLIIESENQTKKIAPKTV